MSEGKQKIQAAASDGSEEEKAALKERVKNLKAEKSANKVRKACLPTGWKNPGFFPKRAPFRVRVQHNRV